ncbi:MAG: hypothetical protein K8J08_13790 [Thermoanaerobaculia bacterium]|nr:hypothetical protein [Thermoanaerobaculia bacterium]
MAQLLLHPNRRTRFARPPSWFVGRLGVRTLGVVGLSLTIGAVAASCLPSPPRTEAEKAKVLEKMIQDTRTKLPEVAEITAEDLRHRLAAGEDIVLVDVRKPEEIAVSTLPNAITKVEFEGRREELKDRTIVTFCTVGYRSAYAAKDLSEEGFEVLNFSGSLLSWTHIGGELVDPEGRPTRRLHVYGRRWDLAADGYVTEW